MRLFPKSNSTLKIYSFEVHFVDIAQIIREWEGGNYCKFCLKGPPPILSSFELLKHSVPQKNRFLMYNLDLGKR